MQLFGWDLETLWLNANQQQCHALFRVGRIGAAVESCQSTMDKSDEDTKARLSEWFTGKSSAMPPNLILKRTSLSSPVRTKCALCFR
jgi:hypothetical protein